jgi:response regulator of citrate/malate metabolism
MIRILHIDDDAAPQELIKGYVKLAAIPAEIVFASSREEALDHLKSFKYDLIILDGNIHDWKNHVSEVQSRTYTEIVMYSSECSDKMKEYLNSGAKSAFDKGSVGTKALIAYIRSKT